MPRCYAYIISRQGNRREIMQLSKIINCARFQVIIALCFIGFSNPAFSDNHILGQPLINSNSGEWVVIQLTDINGNIRDVMVLKGNTSRVGIGTQKPSSQLTVQGHIESKKGFKFPDGSIQNTAQLKGADGARGATGDKGAKGDTGPTVTSIASCVDASSSGAGFCNCSGGATTISKVKSPCNVTSDTGSCSASGFGSGIELKKGQCCVCSQ